MRTKFFDYNANARNPKTDFFCAMCQKDIKNPATARWVHLIEGGATVLHPQDEHLYKPDRGDCGSFPIGSDCARTLGLEWSSLSK